MSVSSIAPAAWPRYSHVAVLLAFFSVVETEKNRTERDQGSTGDVAVLPRFTQNLMLTRCSNRTSILLTAKIATGKGHGEFRRVLPPSGGRAT
jgi:hypothetical protein